MHGRGLLTAPTFDPQGTHTACPVTLTKESGAAERRGPLQMTMDTDDPIAVAHAFPEATIVAVHNHAWAHYTETQDDIAASFGALGIGHWLALLEPGLPLRIEQRL